MQALSACQAAFSSAAPAAARRPQRQQRRWQQQRGGSVVPAAGASPTSSVDIGFCRDKISDPRPMVEGIEGTAKVVFLGVNGEEVEVECPKGGYILDAGLQAGLELPFTCKGGICGCCVGRVAAGEVDQSDIADLSFVLTDEEIENGITMLCMARPVSDVVRVETQSDWGYALGSNDWKGPTGHIKGKKVDPLMGRTWDEIQAEAKAGTKAE